MAFQAVGPLDSEKGVSLRIQLPHSRARIEAKAHVVWLSESKRHAGVRFMDMPPELRMQLRDWLRTQTSPHVVSEGAPGQREIASEPHRKQEAPWEPRKDKWLSLMAKFEVPRLADSTPPEVTRLSSRLTHQPVEREDAPGFPADGLAYGHRHELAEPHEGGPPARNSALPQSAPSVPQTATAKSVPPGRLDGPNPGYRVIAAPNQNRGGSQGILDKPVSPSQVFSPTAPNSSSLRARSPEPPSSRTESQGNSSPISSSAIRAIPAAKNRSIARLWAAGGMLLATLSILSFGIGKWVGSRSARVHSTEASNPPNTATPITEQSASPSNERKANESAPAAAHKDREAHAGDNLAPLSRNLPLPTSPPLFLGPQQNVSPTPTVQPPTPSTTLRPPISSSAPATPDESPQGVPPPTVVGGRTLRPTDRFNPSHLTYRVEPEYPLELQQQRIEGAVKIHLVIGPDGRVRSTKLLSGSPLLAPAAMEAAKYWQYLPALLNGQPVESEQDIEIEFRLPH